MNVPIFIFLLFATEITANGTMHQEIRRTLSAVINPGCNEDDVCNDRNNTLVHIKADSDRDTLHYIWDFYGRPSILVALTNRNVNVTIDWDQFLNGEMKSVYFSQVPNYTFVLVLNKIWHFNDPNDTGIIDGKENVVALDPRNFNWERKNFQDSTDKTVLQIIGDEKYLFTLKAFSSKEHEEVYPHLLHTANSTQIDVIFKNISIPFKNPRLGMEFIMVASEKKYDERTGNFSVNTRKSMDDEHTPGIFEVVEVLSPASAKRGRGSFLQYRPVSYTHPERDVSSSTATKESEPYPVNDPLTELTGSLAYAFFGYGSNGILVQKINITIGEQGDNFYSKTNYTTFTMLAGYGRAPTDVLSAFVIVIAIVGLGVPVLLIVFGACYVCVRRARNQRNEQILEN